jgi:hypothetical protein
MENDNGDQKYLPIDASSHNSPAIWSKGKDNPVDDMKPPY